MAETPSEPVNLDSMIADQLAKGTGIYTPSMAKAVHGIEKPLPGLRVVVTEMGPRTIGLMVYKNQIMALNDYQRGDVMTYLTRVKDAIELHGTLQKIECTYVAMNGDPPDLK